MTLLGDMGGDKTDTATEAGLATTGARLRGARRILALTGAGVSAEMRGRAADIVPALVEAAR